MTETFVCRTCSQKVPAFGHKCTGLQITPAKLNSSPTLEELKHRISQLHASLEEEIRSTYADLDEDGDQEIYSFDSGFIAGLRCALNGLDNMARNI